MWLETRLIDKDYEGQRVCEESGCCFSILSSLQTAEKKPSTSNQKNEVALCLARSQSLYQRIV